jgi:hypothetical protein
MGLIDPDQEGQSIPVRLSRPAPDVFKPSSHAFGIHGGRLVPCGYVLFLNDWALNVLLGRASGTESFAFSMEHMVPPRDQASGIQAQINTYSEYHQGYMEYFVPKPVLGDRLTID